MTSSQLPFVFSIFRNERSIHQQCKIYYKSYVGQSLWCWNQYSLSQKLLLDADIIKNKLTSFTWSTAFLYLSNALNKTMKIKVHVVKTLLANFSFHALTLQI